MRTIRLAALAALALLVIAGCGSRLSGEGSATVAVKMTDAPASEADHLWVDVGRIELVPADDGEPVVVTDDVDPIDVLTLRNGRLEDIGVVDVPTGTYAQVRLIVESATVEFGDEAYPVTVPSGAQTGLKIGLDPALVAGDAETSVVTLDFDASRAVTETPPGSGAYLLKPTGIRAVAEAGEIAGTVLAADTAEPIAGATVDVLDPDGEVVTSTVTEAGGGFRIVTLPAGTYDVDVAADGYVTLRVEDVDVAADAVVDLGELALDPEIVTATELR